LITKGNSIGSVESVKMAADVYSPIDGECLAVKRNLKINRNYFLECNIKASF
jgi:glycine cleavage system H lipoate-binding protein